MILKPVVPSDNYAARLLACCALAMCVIVFFWAYDAIAHRSTAYVPSLTQTPGGDARSHRSMTGSESLAPDMNSAAVLLAQSDVPVGTQSVPSGPEKSEAIPIARPVKKLVRGSHKKSIRVAKSKNRAEGRGVYAQAPSFGFAPFIGF